MTTVSSTTLPAKSRLHVRATAMDFLDCYAVHSDKSVRAAAEIILQYPWWTRGLLKMRNVIVAPLGLATESNVPGEKMGLFPIESESDDEIVLGFNDKHLDFRLSVLSEAGQIFLSTWVHTHNVGGRLYLGAVMPFHVLIIRDALRRVTRTKL